MISEITKKRRKEENGLKIDVKEDVEEEEEKEERESTIHSEKVSPVALTVKKMKTENTTSSASIYPVNLNNVKKISRNDFCSSSDMDIKENLKANDFDIEEIAPNSWIATFRSFYTPSDEQFQSIWNEHPAAYKTIKMFGKDVLLPRYQQAYGRSYDYSGATSESIPETTFIAEMQDRLNSLLRCGSNLSSHENTGAAGTKFNSYYFQFNMCLCNWYEPQHYIGPHADDTRQLVHNSPIASLSWGSPRTFVLTPKKSKKSSHQLGKAAVPKEILVQNGDLLIMGGACQDTHKHEIRKLLKNEPRGNRINFTFRCFR